MTLTLKDPQATLHFEGPYVFQFLWDQFDLTKVINNALKGHEVSFDVAGYIQAMVINRLIDPSSKMHLFDTIEDFYLQDVTHKWQLQHFYRTLDNS